MQCPLRFVTAVQRNVIFFVGGSTSTRVAKNQPGKFASNFRPRPWHTRVKDRAAQKSPSPLFCCHCGIQNVQMFAATREASAE